jgi:hypothetical protein
MDMEIKEVEFSKLRHAYITVKTFLESETYEKVRSLDTKLVADMAVSGDDNYDLLEKFVRQFELDNKGFEYDKHFHTEGELFGSDAAFINLLRLSVWLPLRTIELLTFNKMKLDKPTVYTPTRQVSDLTFKDLLTWYIEKSYKPSSELKYKIKITADT